ncbi:hypothetical protein Q7P37_003020 [Cladosporium fusiforme]
MSKLLQDQTTTYAENEEPVLCQTQKKSLRLAPDGNAILIVLDASGKAIKRFSVSADILSLASPYFDRLFHGHMTEARDLSKLGSVSIDLNEDDPQAVEFILRVLHHKVPDSLATLDLQLIASIALGADKYDTCTILRPWVAYWLDSLEPLDKTPVGIGLRLLATYMNLPKDFGSFWSHHELLQHFPEVKINQPFKRIEFLIQKSRAVMDMGSIETDGDEEEEEGGEEEEEEAQKDNGDEEREEAKHDEEHQEEEEEDHGGGSRCPKNRISSCHRLAYSYAFYESKHGFNTVSSS